MHPSVCPDPADYFMKTFQNGLQVMVGPLLELKQIRHSDLTTLSFIASFGTPRSYRIRLTLKALSKVLRMAYSSTVESVARLRASGLLMSGEDAAGCPYYVIEPDVISLNGSGKHYAAARLEIDNAIAERRKQ